VLPIDSSVSWQSGEQTDPHLCATSGSRVALAGRCLDSEPTGNPIQKGGRETVRLVCLYRAVVEIESSQLEAAITALQGLHIAFADDAAVELDSSFKEQFRRALTGG
jgi:hypothetical protein